jgi:lysophospholipase L1-like esterase
MATEEAEGRLNLFDDPSPLPNTKNINVLVEGIRKKTRGADVRESIAKALEVTYETASKDGNANMEVEKARGAFEVLSERLQSIDKSLNSKADFDEMQKKIQNIVSGSPKGTYANLSELKSAKPTGEQGIFITSDNGHWNYWNGSTWISGGLFQGKDVADNSISKNKLGFLSFSSNSANLFNKSLIKTGGFYRSDGTFENNSNWGYAKISVEAGRVYTINKTVWHIAFFSENTYISGMNGVHENALISVPANANYVTIAVDLKTQGFVEELCFSHGKNTYYVGQNNFDKTAYVPASGIPFVTSGAAIVSNGVPLKINKINNQWQLEISSGIYVLFRDRFRQVASEVIPLPGISQSKGTFLYYDFLDDKIVNIGDNTLNTKDYHAPIGVLFATENPNGWFINTQTDILVNGKSIKNHHSKIKNGQKVGILGDSITAGVGTTRVYHSWLKDILGYTAVENYGIAGSSITKKTGSFPSWDTFESFSERFDSQMANDLDEIIVFGGVNDWISDRPLGKFGDTDKTTFYGACDSLFKGLRSKYLGKNIYIFGPMQNDWTKRTANEGSKDGRNRSGLFLEQYSEAMKQVAKKYAIPFCDMYHEMFYPFTEGFTQKYMPDNLHPNEAGHELMANKMANFIKAH